MKHNKRFWITVASMLFGFYMLTEIKLPEYFIMKDKNIHNKGIVYEKVWEAYDELPENIKEMLDDQHYKIYIVDPLDSEMDGYITLGRTHFMYGVIEISNKDLWVKRTTFHEVGHVIDDEITITFASNSKEFKEIYEEEKEMLKYVVADNHEYFISTEMEYFAQAFSEYMINPECLKKFTPRTYKFIENCVNNI